MKNFLSIYLLIFLSISFNIKAQEGVYYTTATGNVEDMIEVSPGEVWAKSGSSIVHFTNNGSQNTLYTSIPSGSIHVIAESEDTVYIGSDSGIFKFDGGNWNKMTFPAPTGSVTDIHFTASGNMWCISDGSVYEQSGSFFIDHNRLGSCITSYSSTVYVGTRSFSNSGYSFTNSTWTTLPNKTQNKNRIEDLVVDDSGVLWASHNKGVSRLQGQSWIEAYTTNAGSLGNMVSIGSQVYFGEGSSNYFGGSVFRVSSSGLDTLFYPTYIGDDENISIRKGSDGTLLLGKAFGIFRFFPELASQSDYQELTVNNLSLGVSAAGDIGSDFSKANYFQGLQAEGKIALFASNIWLGALNSNGSKVVASNTYKQGGSDFYSGPLSQVYDSLYVSKYNRVWKVRQTEIDTHKQMYGNSSYTVPSSIVTWPGNGDQTKGESKYLAPFVDVDFNGIYEPSKGDYPDIRGDEAIYYIQNDTRGPKTNTYSPSLGIEIHGMMYAFDSSAVPELFNSIFLSYKLINKSTENYQNFTFGFWFDPDLGNSFDDLIGCDSVNGVFYAYNADNDDQGPSGYGNNPPAIGGMYLTDTLSGFSYFNNSSSAGVAFNTTDPVSIDEFYNYLNNQWKDGSNIVVENPNGLFDVNGQNGDGFSLNGSGSKTQFAYNDAYNWFESPYNLADKRGLATLDLGNFSPGEVKCMDIAFVYGRDSAVAPLQSYNSVAKLKTYAQDIRQFYIDQNYTDCLGEDIGEQEIATQERKIEFYPNPVSRGGELVIEYAEGIQHLQMIDLQGKMMKDIVLSEEEQYSLTIDENINSGLYLVVLRSKGQEFSTFKILVD